LEDNWARILAYVTGTMEAASPLTIFLVCSLRAGVLASSSEDIFPKHVEIVAK
jgi:hypothetical protein